MKIRIPHVLAGAVAALALSAAPAAAADSIAFEKGGDIWLTTPNGKRQIRLTHDGRYERPSQDAAGRTIAALRRQERTGRSLPPRQLVRLSPTGQVQGTPCFPLDPDDAGDAGPIDARVSPDGQRVALTYTYSGGILESGFRLFLSPVDHRVLSTTFADLGDYMNGFWLGDDQVGVFPIGMSWDVQFYRFAHDDLIDWFQDPEYTYGSGEIDDSGTRFAAAATRTSDGASVIRVFSLPAPPPAEPEIRCDIQGPAGQFFRPTWSPDGTGLAWQEDDGIHVTRIDLSTCATQAKLVVRGGHAPDWGTAPVPTATAQPKAKPKSKPKRHGRRGKSSGPRAAA